MTEKIIPIQRRAKEEDYTPFLFKNKNMFKLSWQDRLLPGVLSDTPEQGAKRYNEYIDNLPETNKARANNQDIIKAYAWCIDGNLSDDKKVVCNALISAYETEKVHANYLGLGDIATLFVSHIVFNRSSVKATLSNEEINHIRELIK